MTTVDLIERVHARVLELAARPVGELTGSESLRDDLGYDSLTLLELGAALQREFGLSSLYGEAGAGIETVGDVESLVARLSGRTPPR